MVDLVVVECGIWYFNGVYCLVYELGVGGIGEVERWGKGGVEVEDGRYEM